MSEKPSIATIVDLLREILYDILGLFLPGAVFLLILRHSSISVLHNLAGSLSNGQNTTQIAIFVGTSYILGYAIQGISGTVWIPVFKFTEKIKRLPRKIKTRPRSLPELEALLGSFKKKIKGWFAAPVTDDVETGMIGIAPAGLQTEEKIQKSELFRALKEQLSKYCGLNEAKVTLNEVQNLAFSVAGDRSANAFRFSFRADLCAGMFIVFLIGALITITEYGRAQTDQRRLLLTALIYALLSIAFYLRAKFYYNIRGRIVYTIALAVLAELSQNKKEPSQAKTSTLNVVFTDPP